MSYRRLLMPYLIECEPKIARKEILGAFVAAHGSLRRAAPLLGVHRCTLYRWVRRLGLAQELVDAKAIGKRRGWWSFTYKRPIRHTDDVAS